MYVWVYVRARAHTHTCIFCNGILFIYKKINETPPFKKYGWILRKLIVLGIGIPTKPNRLKECLSNRTSSTSLSLLSQKIKYSFLAAKSVDHLAPTLPFIFAFHKHKLLSAMGWELSTKILTSIASIQWLCSRWFVGDRGGLLCFGSTVEWEVYFYAYSAKLPRGANICAST